MNKLTKITCLGALNTGMVMGTALPVFAFNRPTDLLSLQQYTTPQGTASFGQGDAAITIYPNGMQTLIGKSFNVYKLFNAENAAGMESINYTFNPKYAPALKDVVGKRLNKAADTVTEYEVIDYIQTLNTHQTEGAQTEQTLEGSYSDYRYFIEELRNKMVELGLSADIVTVSEVKSDGSFTISGLDYGYYVVDEITDNAGTYQACSLIMVNTANPNASINIKSDYPELIKKILEDDNNVGWNDMADYEIGQTVPYKFESNIPNMNGYDSYFYAWHDKMDDCLTFNPDSVKITITDGTKTYTVPTSEFTVNTSAANETFEISITDIKEIVDREFDHMNSDHENVYGQTVTLEYNATLNDKAAAKTGRSGFENTVRLEFSNDADGDGKGETGYTPWDTVVCFTFKTNVSKVNNHGKELADAKFRLYSDADCQNEIYVKKAADGYIVINRDSLGGNDHTGGSEPSEAVEMVSDAKGLFTIFGLDSGSYYLKETDSPAGYRELEDPIEITITADYVSDRNSYLPGDGATDKALVSLSATAHVKEFLNLAWSQKDQDLQTNAADGSVNITVINTVQNKLPVTGSSATLGLIGIGTLLTAAAAKKSRKKNG